MTDQDVHVMSQAEVRAHQRREARARDRAAARARAESHRCCSQAVAGGGAAAWSWDCPVHGYSSSRAGGR